MRVVIVDRTVDSGRAVAAAIEKVHPAADVLVYDEPEAALAGIAEQEPDVVLVGAELGGTDGPGLMEQARARDDGARRKFVGIVDEPSPELSTRFVDAGARVVVQRPLDSVAARLALRHAGGGVPA